MNIWNDEEFTRLESEFQAARKAFVEHLRSQARPVTADYSFSDGERTYSLADLFGSKDDLITIHNMGVSCSYCTLWADGVNGLLPHLESRASVVLVNEDASETQHKIATARGWKTTMRRDTDGAFSRDMGFAADENGKHYRMPGFSTFHRSADGTITHVASDAFGPGDIYMPVYPMFELLQGGIGNWEPNTAFVNTVTISLPESAEA